MSNPRTSRPAAHPPAGPTARQPAYSEQARSYDHRTGAFQRYRDTIVEALPVSQEQIVLDVGCGTGLCCGLLQEKVGPHGSVIGIEESPEMAAVARERIAAEGWPNVTVVQSPAEDAKIPVTVDAGLSRTGVHVDEGRRTESRRCGQVRSARSTGQELLDDGASMQVLTEGLDRHLQGVVQHGFDELAEHG